LLHLLQRHRSTRITSVVTRIIQSAGDTQWYT